MPDASNQEASVKAKPERTPEEFEKIREHQEGLARVAATKFAKAADELFERAEAVDPKYRTDEEDGRGVGIALWSKTDPREPDNPWLDESKQLLLTPTGTDQGTAIIDMSKTRTKNESPQNIYSGSYRFTDRRPDGGGHCDIHHWSNNEYSPRSLQKGWEDIIVTTIDRLSEAVSSAEARQASASQPAQ